MADGPAASAPRQRGARTELRVLLQAGVWAIVAWAVVLLTVTRLVPPPVPAERAPVRIATWDDSENDLATAVTEALLADADIASERLRFATGADAHRAVELGDADLTLAYSGQVWLEALGRDDPAGRPQASITQVARADAARGVVWLMDRPAAGASNWNEPPVNATFAMVVSASTAADGVTTISELATALGERPNAALCLDPDFAARTDGRDALFRAYGIALDRQIYAATEHEAPGLVATGTCLAGLTSATSGVAVLNDVVVLTDDLSIFPAFVLSPVLRSQVVSSRPDVVEAVRPMTTSLSTAVVAVGNAELLRGRRASDVARRIIDGFAAVPDPA